MTIVNAIIVVVIVLHVDCRHGGCDATFVNAIVIARRGERKPESSEMRNIDRHISLHITFYAK